MAAIRSDRDTAGPAWLAATCPVSTKMPVPMVAPSPMAVRDQAVSTRFSRPAPASGRSTGRTATRLRSIDCLVPPAMALLSAALDIHASRGLPGGESLTVGSRRVHAGSGSGHRTCCLQCCASIGRLAKSPRNPPEIHQGDSSMSTPEDTPGTRPPAANVLDWARKVRAIAQNGLVFTRDEFDRDRYQKLQALTDTLVAEELGLPVEEVRSLWKYDDGYITPKVDVRGAVFKDDRILLVRERSDGKWSLPGGWVDVNDSPSHAIEREIFEESGFRARAVKLAALFDRQRHPH